MNNRLIKSNDAGGGACTNTVDLYNPFPDGGGVALYQLNGDATDVSGNYDGTASNVTYNTGQFGQAGVFNGSSSSINVPYSAGGNITVSAWVKLNQINSPQPFVCLDNLGAATPTRALQLGLSNTNTIYNYWFTGSDITGTTALSTGIWYNIVSTFEQGVVAKIYLNGQFEGQSTDVGTRPVQPNFFIGKYGIGNINYNLNGSIDQVRIFNRALRPYEVEALYTEEYCTPTIVPSEHFNTVLYTGNGSTQSITGAGFQPDFTWIKVRTNTDNHVLQDSVRGVGKGLFSDLTNAENASMGGMTSFDSDGFTFDGSVSTLNGSGRDFVAWNFKAGGSAVTNTDGTITSQVSANTEAGFSIVTFTGNGTTASVGHGLGQKPSIIFTKNRSVSEGWFTQQYMYVPSGNAAFGYLNTTAAFTGFTDSLTDDTVMQQGGTNGQNYVSYCFAEVEGFSNFGSYVGNGVSQSFVLGFEPAFLILKSVSEGSDWFMFDNKRDTTNEITKRLKPNSSEAESTSTTMNITFLENGFDLGSAAFNDSNREFIYMAFAADPTTIEPSLEDSFNTVTYTGNSTDNRDFTNVGFQPDFVWIKARTADPIEGTPYHALFDSVRSADGGYALRTNETASESTTTYQGYVKEYLSNGFKLGAGSSGSYPYFDTNRSGVDYVAWNWKGAELPAINSNGSIPSVVSANPAAGFSIVSYTGNETANQSYGHGLGIAPAMVITKNIDWSVPDWFVWHKDLSGDDYLLRLNKTNAEQQVATVFSSAPNSDVVNIGQDSGINRNGYRQIAYCFAEVAGFSKFGSYTGNGTSQTITTGFEPAFILFRSYDNLSDWAIIDNVRGDSKRLFPNASDAESTYSGALTFTSTGYNLLTSAYNNSGRNFIYMAFANQF